MLLITMDTASEVGNDSKLSVMYYGEKTEVLGKAVVHLTAVEISLDVDADRDGQVERNNPNKGSWMWGPNGHGAILLVNCDSEHTYGKRRDSECAEVTRVSDLKDMSPMVLRTSGPAKLPEGYKLTMHISQGDAESVRVFRTRSTAGMHQTLKNLFYKSFVKDYPLVLGSEDLSKEVPYLGGNAEMNFYVEGLRFPDKDFEGLISISLSLLEPSSPGFPETPIFTDRVVFRVAPWIMTPNTLNPVEVFVCSTSDNYQFLKGMRRLVENSGYKLKVCHEYMNRGDRWMQDEIEFGYIDSPHQHFPVVLDSPRDGKLQDFPYDVLLGPDFGYVTRTAYDEEVSSLDSFGNLEVSPPVIVNGKIYPLGRIIIGVAFPTATKGRNMTKVVQDFLWAQKVQEPIALFSDWLLVGHVDEFMTFVPAPDKKGFRLLLASPDAGYKLFRGLQNDGHGQAKMFDGLGAEKKITVDEILSDDKLRAENNYVQSCIDWNRDVLKRELGLDDDDIIDLPILFHVMEENRAVAYYPDMVNMIVLGKNLGIPKPFGPKVDGRCALEAEMTSLMEGLGLRCTYIDDFASYHKLLGEVHCGSNVRREPFSFKWWNLEM
ncbi:protein-arginine deiminase type-2-like isoform X3 [Oncorhynchus nerka]|nr:protein-arginine deiminase type-2-like isoform X3 [Oncorhynchus nerka]